MTFHLHHRASVGTSEERFARVQDRGIVEAGAEPGHEPLDHVEAEELAALVLGLREGSG